MRRLLFFIMLLSSYHASATLDSAYIYTYGGYNDDYARQIISTSDSGYIIVGTTSSFGVDLADIYLVKTDRNCLKEWSHIYGTPAVERGYSIRQTFDHGYIIAGYTNHDAAAGYDIYLLKVDSMGEVQWTKTIGGTDWDFGYGIELTSDSGFIICGKTYSYSNGGSDVYIVKTDASGNVMWQKNYGGSNDESANAIIRDRNNNYIIVGETKSYGAGDDDVWVLKIDEAGDTLWTKTFGTALFDAGHAIDTTSDGNYICNGTSYGFRATDTTSDMYFFKIDTLGNQLWYQVQGADSSAEEGLVAKEFPDGNLFSGGITEAYGLGKTAYYMLRTDAGGNYLAGCAFGESDYEEGYSIAVGKDNQIVLAGITSSYGCGLFDIYLIRIDTFDFVNEYIISSHEFCDTTIGIDDPGIGNSVFSISPNPVSTGCTIYYGDSNSKHVPYTVKISDVTGKEISNHQVLEFPFWFTRNPKMNSGIYFVSVIQENLIKAVSKMIVY
jgi:hypothetical protein